MSNFNFTLPNGKKFEIKGPAGLTFDQAKQIFDKQAQTGSLVGLNPGDVVSAVSQAAQGLETARAQVNQALSGITGSLNSVTGSLASAASGTAALTQSVAGAFGSIASGVANAGGALGGSLSGIASGLSGAVGSAVTSLTGTIQGVTGTLTQTATTAISTINQTLAKTNLSAPINIGNFAKQAPALTSIGSMTQGVVTGVLAQAQNLVGQTANVVSDAKGLGSFGLNAKQLESAGILKPGMSSLVTATTGLTDLLKSPAAFTGQNGIKAVGDLLSNPAKQSEIQQKLMSNGVSALAASGIPTNLLSAQGLSGLALNAAKSVTDTLNFAKGLPIPGDATGALTKTFESAVRDGAFAANLSQSKVPPEFKAISVPEPQTATVNRDTVDAASQRVLGNDKIPAPYYGPPVAATTETVIAELKLFENKITDYSNELANINSSVTTLENRESITQEEFLNVRSSYVALVSKYAGAISDAREAALNAITKSSESAKFIAVFTTIDDSYSIKINRVGIPLAKRISQLRAKVSSTIST